MTEKNDVYYMYYYYCVFGTENKDFLRVMNY